MSRLRCGNNQKGFPGCRDIEAKAKSQEHRPVCVRNIKEASVEEMTLERQQGVKSCRATEASRRTLVFTRSVMEALTGGSEQRNEFLNKIFWLLCEKEIAGA